MEESPKGRIGFQLRHNNMTITIAKPTIECVRETINDGFFKVFMPDETIREQMIEVFSKKLADKDYQIVRKKND